MWARESKVALMLQIDSEQQPSFESLESFLSYFELVNLIFSFPKRFIFIEQV